MKQAWQKLALKIDALSTRERAFVFAAAATVLVFLLKLLLLDPVLAKQKQFSQQAKQDREQSAAMQNQIQQKVALRAIDPDASNRARLQALKEQIAQMQASLRDMQNGLVSPDRMARLLEDIVKQNGQLRVMSLKTLPVTSLTAALPGLAPAGEKAAAPPAAVPERKQVRMAADEVYRHGLEITLQGSYLDMMHYMAALEAMPWQLFWAGAQLNADNYPKSTLTLTLYTFSLDKKWLNL